MKKTAIVALVACCLVFLLLLGLMLFLFRTDFGGWGFNFGSIGINGGIQVGGYTYRNSESYKVGPAEIDPSGISRVEIHWVAGEIRLAPADGDSITIRENEGLKDEDRLRYLVDGSTLIIQFCAPRAGIYTMENAKTLEMGLPESLLDRLDKLTVEAVSADGTLVGVRAETCKIENVSGEYEILDCGFGELSLDTVSGGCFFRGSVEVMDVDTVSGSVTAELTGKPRKVDADTVSGNVELAVPSDFGFRAEVDGVSGDLECDLPVTKKGDTYICGDGSAELDLDTVSGDLVIRGLDQAA